MIKIGLVFFFNRSLEDYDGQCLPATLNYDGSGFLFQVHIGLINGKGKYYETLMALQFKKDN